MRKPLVVLALLALFALVYASDLPEVITLDSLAKRYVPVEFTHQEHIEFAEDCSRCHHHSEEPLACSECHEPLKVYRYRGVERKTGLGLKGAYHGLCLGCHKEAEAPVGCTDCHERAPGG